MFNQISLGTKHYAQLLFIYSKYNTQKIICVGLQHLIECEGLGSVVSAKN